MSDGGGEHDASQALAWNERPVKSAVGRSGVASAKCRGRTVIRYEHDIREGKELIHRKGDPVLDEEYRRSYRPCEAWAANGTEYCSVHGGSAPQTINASKRALALAAENAALGIIATSEDERLPADVRLKAQAQILDRVGVRAGVDVTLEAPGWQKLLGEMFGEEPEPEDVAPERFPGENQVKERVRKLTNPANLAESDPAPVRKRTTAKASPPAAPRKTTPRKAAPERPKFEGW